MRTRIDVLAFVVLAVVLASYAFVFRRSFLEPAAQIECAGNLKRIYVAYETFVADHGLALTETSTNSGGTLEWRSDPSFAFQHFRTLGEYGLSPADTVCPLDSRKASPVVVAISNQNLSYFLSMSPARFNADWCMSGNRNLTQGPVLLNLKTFNSGWNSTMGLHRNRGYLLLGNGRVEVVESDGFGKIANAQPITNIIVVP